LTGPAWRGKLPADRLHLILTGFRILWFSEAGFLAIPFGFPGGGVSES